MATKKPSIKLLFFSPYFYPYVSGLTQYPYRLFTESGLPLDVTCLTFKHAAELKNSEKMSSLVIRRMPFWFRLSKGFISPSSLSYFWNETKKNNVIMLNLPSIEGLALAVIAGIQNKPVISLLHCEVLLPFSFSNLIINFILNCGVFIQLLLSKKILIYTKDYYEKKWMYSFFRHKMEMILPPVHTTAPDTHYLHDLGKQTKQFDAVIGFCGRIAAEKGVEVLIESVSSMKNTVLLFAGPTGKDVIGEEAYFQKIEKKLIEKKIPHVFLGTLSGGMLSAFYNHIDVLVLPSLNKTEAFGMVQVEAMMQGTPVIASNLPGVRVPIHMTNMGIVVEPYDVKALKQAVLAVLHNKSKFTNPQLIHTAKTLFDSQKTYASIYTTIHQCLK